MTNEEQILEQLAALTRSHEAFVIEWRTSRDEARAKSERLLAESERRRVALEKRSKRATVLAYIFAALFVIWFVAPSVLGSLILWFWHPK